MTKPSEVHPASWCFLLLAFIIMTSLTAADNVLMAAIQPPDRPENFRNMDELNTYLEKLKKYYTIIGRPRFGKRADWSADYSPYMESILDSPVEKSGKFGQDPKDLQVLVSRLLARRVSRLAGIQDYEDIYKKRR